ncbi:smalltalk protein [Bacteroides sp.]|nr:smalltalk protein [Bacteroides sp.]
MNKKSSTWDYVLKVIIALASALLGALGAHACPYNLI